MILKYLLKKIICILLLYIYRITPFYSSINHKNDDKNIWFDVLYHNGTKYSEDVKILTYGVLSYFHESMMEIEKDYKYISNELREGNLLVYYINIYLESI